MSNSLLANLDTEQLEAVIATEGYIRVIAGAGSGKTRALAHRFAFLVDEIGVLPGHILCATFTNKSANEMKQRIRRLTGDKDTGYICTFHSFCVSVLQEDINTVQYPKSFLTLDNEDINAMLKVIYEERGLTLRHMTYGKARDMIEIRKVFKEPDYYHDMIALSLAGLRQKYLQADLPTDIIFYGYLYQQKKCFGLDYNDLINFVLHIFQVDQQIKLKWQQRLEYIMIDEYQDIDDLQYRLTKALCSYHHNLFIVGDPDQTIYTWRGASTRFLLNFDQEFPNVQTIMMMRNYRSTPQILASANSLISHNQTRIPKDLIPTQADGTPVVYHHAATAVKEALWITEQIKELAAQGAHLNEIAILYRAHYLSRTLEEVFLKEGLPYTIYSGTPFFSRAEIKDALAYLRLLIFHDDLSLLRVINTPKRNLGQKRLEFLQQYTDENNCSLYKALEQTKDSAIMQRTKAKQLLAMLDGLSAITEQTPVSELLSTVLEQSGYEAMLRTEGSQERLDNLAELKQAVYEFERFWGEECTPEDYLSRVALLTNTDTSDKAAKVKMLTIHTAKGLEFPYVFVCGLTEGVFPSHKTNSLEGMEEERRLAFVAFTRAEKKLFLSDSGGRNLDGSFRYPSRFIFNVNKDLLSYTGELDEALVYDAQNYIQGNEKALTAMASYKIFKVGEQIMHSVFGAGEILHVDEQQNAYTIQFQTLPTPRRISFKAQLKPKD